MKPMTNRELVERYGAIKKNCYICGRPLNPDEIDTACTKCNKGPMCLDCLEDDVCGPCLDY
jgi:hypothetical protein